MPAAIACLAVFMVALGSCSPAPLGGVASVSAGSMHTCALMKDGTVNCWGANSLGQIGDGTTAAAPNPVPVTGLSGASAVSAGQMHTCALLKDGSVKCWGAGILGQLGAGAARNALSPVDVTGLKDATAVAAGWSHTCALLNDGGVKCWGGNGSGQIGAGVTAGPETCTAGTGEVPCSRTPVAVKGLGGAVAISAGGDHTCALLKDGTVGCWGANDHGQLGLATSSGPDHCAVSGWDHGCAATVQIAKKITDAVAVAAGGYHTCALLADAGVRCWGPNLMGQLATGRQKGSWTPVASRDLDGAIAVSAGLMHNCAVMKDGTVRCWGSNNRGQLGATTGRDSAVAGHSDAIRSTLPVTVSRLVGAAAVSSGGEHTCALMNDTTVQCWGNNEDGRLGGGVSDKVVPHPVVVRLKGGRQ